MNERLQKIISGAGLASRRKAEELISAGRVQVNGVPATLGQSADPGADVISVDGVPLRLNKERTYIMLNKPCGYVTTLSDEKGRRTVSALITDVGKRLYPVGRLDMYSEGLLIMTDDGNAANALMHPSHNVKKKYRVWVRGADIEASMSVLRQPMEIDGYTIRPADVSVISKAAGEAQLEIGIFEGRNRQVRKMCDISGLRVLRLLRIAEGELQLGELHTGKWRHLTPQEIAYICSIG
ncbi:MAG: rRNA pseudouridine synthase [Clostridia bacterium]|nr:rRNA pseudouridine synthase [Clostridia bacterium]NCC68932.1 rRNA pseudouridine synthase [Clostridia bacterium]